MRQLLQERPSAPVVRFSEFLGIGYFGDERQHVIAPIFDSRHNAEKGWTRVMEGIRILHAVFVEHQSKYEFIAYPPEMDKDRINYVIYRSFSSLASLCKFKETYSAKTFIKFGWHDLTRPQKFDVMPSYMPVDGVEFLMTDDVRHGSFVDRVRKNELL